MLTDPLIYIRKLESQLAEAQKQENLEHAPHTPRASPHHFFAAFIKRLEKWTHWAAPHGKA